MSGALPRGRGGWVGHRAYNPVMFHALNQLVGNAFAARSVLLVNHILAAEPVASGRLQAHAGRCLRVQLLDWPDLLPALPRLCLAITAAGLLEWQPDVAASGASAGAQTPVDLDITVDAGNPASLLMQGLMGKRPSVSVSGDAALAADVSWVIDNLRWDLREDLANAFGDLPARELSRRAAALADGLRSALQGLAQRARSTREGAASDGEFGTGAQPPSPAQRPAR